MFYCMFYIICDRSFKVSRSKIIWSRPAGRVGHCRMLMLNMHYIVCYGTRSNRLDFRGDLCLCVHCAPGRHIGLDADICKGTEFMYTLFNTDQPWLEWRDSGVCTLRVLSSIESFRGSLRGDLAKTCTIITLQRLGLLSLYFSLGLHCSRLLQKDHQSRVGRLQHSD